MKTLPLVNSDEVALVDDDRFERLSRFRWTLGQRGIYTQWRHKNAGRIFLMISHAVIGKPKRGLETDHKDRNIFNNQRHNLRHCTHQQNSQNRKGWSACGVKGVYFSKWHRKERPWRAEIRVNGKKIRLGNHATPQEAGLAYNQAAIRYFGEFAAI